MSATDGSSTPSRPISRAKRRRPEVVAVMHKATADLIASGQAERALKAGATAPNSNCRTPTARWSLGRSAREGPLV